MEETKFATALLPRKLESEKLDGIRGNPAYGLPVYPKHQRGNDEQAKDRLGERGEGQLRLLLRVLQEHDLDDPGVIIQGNGAVDRGHQDQPVDPPVDDLGEEIDLPDEAREGRDARQREQEDGEGNGGERRTAPEA